jgi:hypothetical protein
MAGQGRQDRPKLPVDQVLADGSWLSRIYAASDRRRRHPITVRVVEYTVSDPGRRTNLDRYRLVTTIVDPPWRPPPSWPRCTPSGGRSRPRWPS